MKNKERKNRKITIILTSIVTALLLSCPVIISIAAGTQERGGITVSPLKIIVSLVIGLVVALIVTSVMKSKLRSVSWNNFANEYIDRSSFKLYIDDEVFLYDDVKKTLRLQIEDRDH
jgi:hypothetical protein